MMTKDDDQVEAKGTGVIWTANQIVTYTTIETDIKVNSKTLESLTILNAWFQSMVTMVSYIMQARKKRCFRDNEDLYDWMLPSLPLKHTNQSGTTLSTLRRYSTE